MYLLRTNDATQVVAVGEGPRPSVELVALARLPRGWSVQPLQNILSTAAMGKAHIAAQEAGLRLAAPSQMYQVPAIAPAPVEVARGGGRVAPGPGERRET